ncbi:hypothetical protein M1L60_07640 [Actinoplanes sp. TRM 88003]|uniref:ABC transporter permease n=1 Tax=Paractinoplanes aksuensis TaxID=2939490 RepID=A0ABT1DI22_9ACTN|nr:hypothetical protein [Actinoplanes aksuensis]MCO8270467.1 hypothetical protein [Actinoplanes aksuensis]
MSRLDVRYRLLLRAYPPGRRRGELTDTLLEAGRGRPSVREGLNLLRYGLRARLGRPASHAVVVLATLIAVVAGVLGAAVTTRLAWEAVPALPSGERLADISGTVFPGLPTTTDKYTDELFYDLREPSLAKVLLTGHEEDFQFSDLIVWPDDRFLPGDYRQWTTAAQGRLVEAGWEVGEAQVTGATWIATGEIDDSGRLFTATRDGLALEIATETDVVDTPAGSFYVTAEIDRLTPGWVLAAGVSGLLVGALLGWLATGWVSRRTELGSARVRSLTREPAWVALVLLLPQALLALVGMIGQQVVGGAPHAPFWALSVTYGYGCGLLGFVLFGVSVVTAAVAGRGAAGIEPVVTRERL